MFCATAFCNFRLPERNQPRGVNIFPYSSKYEEIFQNVFYSFSVAPMIIALVKRNGFRKPFRGSVEYSCRTEKSPQETFNKQTSQDELRSTFEIARVKTAFVSSLSYFSGRAQSKSGGKEGRRGSAITLIRKKCPRKETERVREGEADIERRAFLPNSFRLIFAQGRICHYTHSKGRETIHPCERTGSLLIFC